MIVANLILAVAAAGGILAKKQPNIILLLSDDQDVRMNSLEYMPILQKHLGEEGTKFEKHYVTTAICCPSRVSILKGQFAHNTNFTDVGPPTGGFDLFLENKLDEEYLPVWLQRAGYSTNYIGKFINGYGVPNHKKQPKGWDTFDALVNPWIYDFYHPVFARNGNEPKHYPGIHQVDVVREKALNVLTKVTKDEKPFFLYLAPSAPHTTVTLPENDPDTPDLSKIKLTETIPADRHKDLFPHEKIPRIPSFNSANVDGKPKYIAKLPLLNQTTIDTLDHWYRQRLRNLQSVDELLGSVIEFLTESGELDNTYIFYSTDNGYHIGLHRLNAGKTTPYEDDVNVPFYVRGPGVAKGKVRQDVNSHTDIAPTFLKIAGAKQSAYPFDGEPIPIFEHDVEDKNRETLGVEFWRPLVPEYYSIPFAEDNTYRSLRVNGDGYSYLYTVWCTGHRELYDHTKDPYQLENVYSKASRNLVNRLDALLVAIHDCKGVKCQKPWNTLLPGVKNLGEALKSKYDGFFATQKKLIIRQCLAYYDVGNEVIVQNTENDLDYLTSGKDGLELSEVKKGTQQPLVLQEGSAELKVATPKKKKSRKPKVSTVNTGHKIIEGDIESYGVPLTEQEIQLANHPHAYDYD
ncbi:putative arylsulfatase [Obelidium mucronatum]|nr:putative arylsulfatase [Obelidium mucronatum]